MGDDFRDRRGFDEMCRMLAPRMTSLAKKLTGSSATAEDVFQEAALRVWKRMPDLDPAIDLRAYLARVVTNLCADARRRRGREAKLSLSDMADLPAASPYTDEVLLRDLMAELRRSLDCLSEQQRAALVLRYFEGLDYRRVAQLLGCRESTARSHVSAAKDALKRKLRFVQAFRDLSLREERR